MIRDVSTASEPPYGRRRRWGVIFGAVWLIFLVQPLLDLLQRQENPALKVVGVALFIVFVAAYILVLDSPFALRDRAHVWVYPIVLFCVSLCLLPLTGESGLNAFVFVAVAAQSAFPVRWAIVACCGLVVLCVVLIALIPGWTEANGYPFSIAAASLAMFGVVRMADRNRALIVAQREQARLAVFEERERFARDLHDILGHSLTVITVKSQLAARLIDLDPERARAEIRDIERLSREALTDVRSTVGGYREVSLLRELAAARTALSAAGIAAQLPGAVDDIPGDRSELFGWVLREGVTNVVRHSAAQHCVVTLTPDSIEITDDGIGCQSASSDRSGSSEKSGMTGVGHGLSGIQDRVQAAGGQLSIGPGPTGGFRLAVSINSDDEWPRGSGVASAENRSHV